MDLLVLLLERRGQLVSRSDIVERLWGEDVFVDVVTGVNTLVWKVRTALNDSPDDPRYIETVSGRGYRFIAAVQVVSDEKPPEPAGPGGRRTSQTPAATTIVVLPFQNLSSDEEQEYFTDGLTDETISALGQLNLPHLRVVARTSSMAYKRTTKTAAQIGQELRADYLLESSVRREVDRIRIATRLIRVADEAQVWSETYNRTPDGVLGVQDEIGHAIASQVLGQFPHAPGEHPPHRPTRDLDAYDLYLRGTYHEHRFAIPDAIASFEAAVERDPSYALAHAGLAHSYALIPISGDAEPLEYLDKSTHAAAKALALDPQLVEGHAAAGWADFCLGWDWPRAERALRLAIGLNPNYALGRWHLAHLLSNSFRHDEAIEMILSARDLDPLSALMHSFHGQFLFDARRYPEALKPIQRAITIDSRFFHGHEILSRLYLQLGDLESALTECELSYELSGGMLFALARKGHVLAKLGRPFEAQQILRTLQAMSSERFVAPFHFAMVHAGLGQREATLNCLERAVDVRAVQLVLLPTDPMWDEYRDEPRFRALVARCGFSRGS